VDTNEGEDEPLSPDNFSHASPTFTHHCPCQPERIAPEDGAHRRGALSAGGECVDGVQGSVGAGK
jgi:hypothetical protein